MNAAIAAWVEIQEHGKDEALITLNNALLRSEKTIRSEMKDNLDENYKDVIELLLTGDPNNNAGILKMDQVVFEEVVRQIETAYDKADLGNNTSLQALFYNKTQNKRG